MYGFVPKSPEEKQNFEEFRIFVTGGFARDVAKSTHINVEFVENLVLIGLSRFI